MAKGGYRGGMPMMGGMNQMQMMKQAQKMQQDLLKMQQEMETKEYEATAGGGVVTAVANGKRELLRINDRPGGRRSPTMWRCCRIWSSRRRTRRCARPTPNRRRACRS